MNPTKPWSFVFAVLACTAAAAHGQAIPRIAAVFPAGAKTGEVVEVALRGSNLGAARKLLVLGPPGVSAELLQGGGAPDASARPVFQARCTSCHEARSADNRTLGPEQWAQVVDRMIDVRGADIPKADRDRIVGWLQAAARAGVVSARLTVAKDAAPGTREVRLVTDNGVSAGFNFEVGSLPEIVASGDTAKADLPLVLNGALARPGQQDRVTFEAVKGQRLNFNLKGYRLNEQSWAFFNPALFIEDANGKAVAKSLGRFGLDPLIEWTCPKDGAYTLVVRDLLWKGNPASVYRLVAGAVPYDSALSPLVARPGATVDATLAGDDGTGIPVKVRAPVDLTGVARVPTPLGDAPVLVRDIPDGGGPVVSVQLATSVTLPAAFSGRIVDPAKQVDRFRVRALQAGGLEVHAARLGSSLRPKVTVRNANGDVVATRTMTDDNDPSIGDAFKGAGEYVVEVQSDNGLAGSYAWEATLGKVVDFALTATPDGVNLAPGQRGALLVRAMRRENIPGPISVTIADAPKWLTVEPGIIPPDDDKAVVLITVADDAPVGGANLRIEGTTLVPDRIDPRVKVPLVRRARPIELYRGNNLNVRQQERLSSYVGVTRDRPPFALVLDDPQPVVIKPGGEVRVAVQVHRAPGFRGAVIVQFQGLPPGIVPQPFQVQVGPESREAVFTLKANGGARFLTERPDKKLPPMRFCFVGTTGGADAIAPYQSSLTVPLLGPLTKVDLTDR
ncbi:MAG: c-type cytochrome [Armatimonadota bacterium]